MRRSRWRGDSRPLSSRCTAHAVVVNQPFERGGRLRRADVVEGARRGCVVGGGGQRSGAPGPEYDGEQQWSGVNAPRATALQGTGPRWARRAWASQRGGEKARHGTGLLPDEDGLPSDVGGRARGATVDRRVSTKETQTVSAM